MNTKKLSEWKKASKEYQAKLEGQGKGEGAGEEGVGTSLKDAPKDMKFEGKRPDTPEYKTVDADGNITEYGRWYYERPSNYIAGVRNESWEKAAAESIDGKIRDPKTGEVLDPNKPWDMGHKPGYEFRKHQQSAAQRGINREEFLNEYNISGHYRPEDPSSNRGHSGEAADDVYLGP